MADVKEAVKRFLEVPRGYGFGDGSGSGYGDGYGSGYGDGFGFGYGSGYGDGYGYGSGDGYVTSLAGDPVNMVDNVPTIIDHVHGNAAKGRILMADFTTKDCYVVKNEDGIFAHGDTVREAMNALLEKQFDDMPEEKRIEAFLEAHREDKKYPAQDLFDWHHRLTGSCMAGRKAFCLNHQIDLENDSFTVDEFINLTRDDYGGCVIRNLEKKRKEETA